MTPDAARNQRLLSCAGSECKGVVRMGDVERIARADVVVEKRRASEAIGLAQDCDLIAR